jgi:hypothetical protein
MATSVEDLANRLSRVEEELRRVLARLDELTARGNEGPVPSGEASAAGPASMGLASATETAGPAPAPETAQGASAFFGRTLLALGGGFLIRALTDRGWLPPAGGVLLGLAYAAAWLVLADRAARSGQRASATVHGFAGALLVYPLLWEVTTRFRLLTAGAAVALGAVFLAATVVVAGRRGLAPVNWLATLLALGTTFGLFFPTRDILAVTFGLLAIAVVVEGLALRDHQPGLRWPAAALADIAVVTLVWLVTLPAGLPGDYPPVSPRLALLATLALPAVFFGGTVVQTLGRGRRVDAFEVAQGTLALALGFGGGLEVLRSRGEPPTTLGLAGLALGVLCYWAAFAFVERRHAHASSFYLYSAAGGVLTLFASRVLLGSAGAVLAWCGLAVLMTILGRRFSRLTLGVHGVVYLVAAALTAGLLGDATRALTGSLPVGPLSGHALTVLVTALVLYAARLDRGPDASWWKRLPGIVAATIGVWGLGGLVVVTLVARVGPLASEPSALATLRTGVLSLLAVGLAEAARRASLPELGLLVYPLLALTGLKVLGEDLPAGNPATLFMSFAFYGTALILAPRRLRRE